MYRTEDLEFELVSKRELYWYCEAEEQEHQLQLHQESVYSVHSEQSQPDSHPEVQRSFPECDLGPKDPEQILC